jgi:hypothetical protein
MPSEGSLGSRGTTFQTIGTTFETIGTTFETIGTTFQTIGTTSKTKPAYSKSPARKQSTIENYSEPLKSNLGFLSRTARKKQRS